MCSETSTVQHIIYNIKTGLFGTRVVLRKRLDSRALEFLFPSPAPPRKNIHNPPKNVSPSNFPSPVRPGIDSMGSPHPRTQVHRTHAKDSHPKPASERAPDPSGTRISSPRTIARAEQPWCAQRNPVVCPRNGPGLSAHRPQSGGCPVHLLLLPSTGVKKPALKHFSQESWNFLFRMNHNL
jgi:hypothetical protein